MGRAVKPAKKERGAAMQFEDLTPEMKEKARACKTPEELLELAKSQGFELSDDDLEAISGGREWGEPCNDWICGVIGH